MAMMTQRTFGFALVVVRPLCHAAAALGAFWMSNVNGCGRQGNYTFTQMLQALKDHQPRSLLHTACRVRANKAGKGVKRAMSPRTSHDES